ncbi:MAG: hypothetical protein HGB32_02990 [Geobacteraceae bacterium]|nr:hypothetical protein [Geobacteraceae bacterium]NTW79099.1 hypothetical protein [Geobacteraceae bacterium]
MVVVHRTERFDRCLEEMRQDGGEAVIAAEKAEQLIREIAQGDSSQLEQRWKTNNGEARIDGCRKFYIGRRYRLVCIKQGQQILLLHAGTHDDCDRWLDSNRGTSFGLEQMAAARPSAPESTITAAASDGVPDDGVIADGSENPSQRELRIIFRGLC